MRTLAPLVTLCSPSPAAARDLPAGFVYLRDVAPTIAQDIRYATYDNFTGRPLPGYAAGECVLRREVAQALARVQADLAKARPRPESLRLLPPGARGRAMWRWAQRGDGGAKRFYPTRRSSNCSRSATSPPIRAIRPATRSISRWSSCRRQRPRRSSARARYGPCTAPAAERAPDNTLDMGTGFDCLDAKSATRSARDHRRAAALAAGAQRRHARAGLLQLFPRMVALLLRRARRAGL